MWFAHAWSCQLQGFEVAQSVCLGSVLVPRRRRRLPDKRNRKPFGKHGVHRFVQIGVLPVPRIGTYVLSKVHDHRGSVLDGDHYQASLLLCPEAEHRFVDRFIRVKGRGSGVGGKHVPEIAEVEETLHLIADCMNRCNNSQWPIPASRAFGVLTTDKYFSSFVFRHGPRSMVQGHGKQITNQAVREPLGPIDFAESEPLAKFTHVVIGVSLSCSEILYPSRKNRPRRRCRRVRSYLDWWLSWHSIRRAGSRFLHVLPVQIAAIRTPCRLPRRAVDGLTGGR